jgi:hypothetical protein
LCEYQHCANAAELALVVLTGTAASLRARFVFWLVRLDRLRLLVKTGALLAANACKGLAQVGFGAPNVLKGRVEQAFHAKYLEVASVRVNCERALRR